MRIITKAELLERKIAIHNKIDELDKQREHLVKELRFLIDAIIDEAIIVEKETHTWERT